MNPWTKNLAWLRGGDALSSSLAEALEPLGPAPDAGLRDRKGAILPGLTVQGRARSLVSTFDPDKEAARWAEGFEGGTAAVYGAAGLAAWRGLRQKGARLVFWLEPRLEVWRSLLTWEDWSGEPRPGWVPVAATPLVWEAVLKERYHPAWDGAFRTLEWRAATTGFEDLWDAYRSATARALDALSSDVSTQARFGERWYRNTLANLKRLRPAHVDGCRGARVVIAGAGPGLDDALAAPENQRWLEERPSNGGKLFSTDTAFPALTAQGVVPDVVLCLDGQLPTYHHFVPSHPAVPLVADLSSLPLLSRVGMPVVRYLSGHPFGAVIRRYFPELPALDGSLGNVSGLALRAAQALGAATVEAWGADFSYRDGQAYAHGTYVYALAERRANRLEPMETRLGASCYGARGLERTRDSWGRALDTTPLLRDYRQRWEAARVPSPPVSLDHGGAEPRWEAFADHWRQRLRQLPLPLSSDSMRAFVVNLPKDRREDWLALWPLAAVLLRQGIPQAALAEAVRDRALSFIQD